MYLYETHLHTAEVSRCASGSASGQAAYYKRMGFTGIVVTDHFLGGNTIVPDGLTWEQKVNMFCKGYELAAEEGEKLGLDVFFAWEYTYMGIDFLTYGLNKAWLLDHPDIDKLFINDYLDLVRNEGAFVVHAHPFREEAYIPVIQLMPRRVDAVETINAERKDFENRLAAKYAEAYGLKISAGSDNHHGVQESLCAIGTDKKLETIADFISVMRSSAFEIVRMPG
ncbi:MAG: histidinol phosphatase [Clostridiales bacterium]|nr:histidinol phosphatase [Clostridiales bacterium]